MKPIIAYEYVGDSKIHLMLNGRIICNTPNVKKHVRGQSIKRCERCFSVIKSFSWNVEKGYWQTTIDRNARDSRRSIKIGQIFIDPNRKDWIYLGKWNTVDNRNLILNGIYLIRRVNSQDYLVVKELKIEKLGEMSDVDTNIEKIKAFIVRGCKTYDDYLKYSLLLNLSTKPGHLHPYFMRQ